MTRPISQARPPHRLNQLAAALDPLGVEAAMLSAPHHLRAFCGVKASAGTLVIKSGNASLLLDPRYRVSALLPPEIELVPYRNADDLPRALQAALGQGVRHIGVHAGTLTLAELQSLFQPHQTYQAIDPLIAELTSVLDTGEMLSLQQAHALSKQALNAVEDHLTEGVTERTLYLHALETILAGDAALAFDPLVVSGEKTAWPHAASGERRLAQGELVFADLGAVVDGLHADLTRTWLLGENEQAQELLDLTHAALQAAIQAVHPQATAAEIDEAGRRPFRQADLDAYTLRGIGHALGYEVHQPPILREHGQQTVQVGQVLALEPGVYLPGFGGVRLEEMVVVTAVGAVPIEQWRPEQL